MKHVLKYFSLTLAVLFMAVSFTACSDDDDDDPKNPTFGDYYVECTKVTGGGLDAQACAQMQAELTSSFSSVTLEKVERKEAIEFFDEVMTESARDLASIRPKETLRISFALKMVGGQTVKTSTIVVTENGSSVQ